MELTIPLNILRAAALFCNKDEAQPPNIRHLYIEVHPEKGATIMATDGRCMMAAKVAATPDGDWPDTVTTIAIPPAAVEQLAAMAKIAHAGEDARIALTYAVGGAWLATLAGHGWSVPIYPVKAKAPNWRPLFADAPRTMGTPGQFAVNPLYLGTIGEALELMGLEPAVVIFSGAAPTDCMVIAPTCYDSVRWLLMPMRPADGSPEPTLLGFLEGGK